MLKWDLHTHTRYSGKHHAKGTIEENAAAAAAAGLKALGISDHGPGHFAYGLDLRNAGRMRTEIKLAEKAHPGLKIYLGVEANIINASGALDISKEDLKLFDYVMAGYHKGVIGESRAASAATLASTLCYSALHRSSKRRLLQNTEMMVRSIYENDLYILTHPGEKAAFDMLEIIKACEATNTLMEINDHHEKLSIEDLRLAAPFNVNFVIGSDAHRPQDAGSFERALARADAAGIPHERIVNLD